MVLIIFSEHFFFKYRFWWPNYLSPFFHFLNLNFEQKNIGMWPVLKSFVVLIQSNISDHNYKIKKRFQSRFMSRWIILKNFKITQKSLKDAIFNRVRNSVQNWTIKCLFCTGTFISFESLGRYKSASIRFFSLIEQQVWFKRQFRE